LSVQRSPEGGYTLVALLALMTVLALFAMAAAPSIRQQAVREREREAIFRGEQVADAIRVYYLTRGIQTRGQGDQALPTSIDQLLEGVPIQGGAKNRQILRPSAARDPLTAAGEWRFIRPRSQSLIDFEEAVMLYAQNVLPQPQHPQMRQLQQLSAPMITSILNTGSTSTASSGSAVDEEGTGPFVGVASKNKTDSVLTYYGIERHDQWIFTPLFRN
jgi:type II secretory pathway pseudopilin PulG